MRQTPPSGSATEPTGRSAASPSPGRRPARRSARTTGTALLGAAVIGGLLTAAPPAATAEGKTDPDRRVIVTLDGAAAAAGLGKLTSGDKAAVAEARTDVKSEQSAFLSKADEAGVEARKPRKLGLLLNAVAVTVKASQVAELKQLPGVTGVFEDRKIKIQTSDSVPTIGAPEVWERKDPSGTKARGKGVTVAVLDSGVDYTHPDLGGGLGEGHKVVAGYDFANDDADPMDDNGHGTHVAGIIAGSAAEPGGITGVAPEATITAYKVMDAGGYGETSDIIAGLEAAVDPANPHRADVVNMSIGGPGDGFDPLGLAATAATQAGVVVVAAAGNEGPGPGTVGSPAAADGVIAVGASVSGLRLPAASYAGGEKIQVQSAALSANPPVKPAGLELVDVGYGTPEEFDAAGDVKGKAVRVSRPFGATAGDITIEELEFAREAEKRGVVAAFGGQPGDGPVVAGEPGVDGASAASGASGSKAGLAPGMVAGEPRNTIQASGDSLRMDDVVLMGVDGTQFEELGRRLAAGKVEVSVKGNDVTDQMANFSSHGPDASWDLKPDIVAPGYEIRSTVPKALYGPGVYPMSGTSMAAPHVAGAAALLRQLHPDEAPAKVVSELAGSSKQLKEFDAATVGAGRLDLPAAADAADAGITTSPSTLSFGLADMADAQIGGSRRLTVNNASGKVRYVHLEGDDDARVTPSVLRVPAHGSANATVTLRADRPTVSTEISGQITVAPVGGGPELHVPYLLSVRALMVQGGPDPSEGKSSVSVISLVPLGKNPVVTVRPPHGRPFTVSATQRNAYLYQADLEVTREGAYQVSARAEAADGKTLTGNSDGFEVTPASTRGDKWRPVGPNTWSDEVTVAPSAPGHAVLTQSGKLGVWSTTDNGKTWRQNGRLPLTDVSGQPYTVIDAKNEKRWWYAANSASGIPATANVLRTEDGGRTWERLEFPDGEIKKLVADEQTNTLVAWTSSGLTISHDGGDTWQQEPTGVTGDIYDVAVGGDNLYFAANRGTWKRTGVLSGKLGPAEKVYTPAGRQSGVVITADSELVATYELGTGIVGSYDGGKTWSTLNKAPSGGSGLTLTGGEVYYGYGATTLVGRDHGRTWEEIPGPGDFVTLDVDRWADGSLTVASSSNGLYRTDAKGSKYERIGVQGGTVNDLEVSGDTLLAAGPVGTHRTQMPVTNPEWGFTGTEGTRGNLIALLKRDPKDTKTVWRVRKGAFGDFIVERSTDAGVTWEEKGHGSGLVWALEVHPADSGKVYVSYGNSKGSGLFATTDGGGHWKNLHHDGVSFTAIAGDPSDADRLWLGTPDGLYRSDDGGAEIEKKADGGVDAIEYAGSKLLVGGAQLRWSTDGGHTFRTGDTGELPVRIKDFERIGSTLYAAAGRHWDSVMPRGGRGVLRSTDGGRTWHNVSSGLQNLDVTSLATDGEDLYAGTEFGGVHRLDLD